MSAVHPDTLDAIEAVCIALEDRQFEKRDISNRAVGEYECIQCGQQVWLNASFGRPDTPEDQRHKPDCKLVKRLTILRAFVRIERGLP